MLQGEARNGRVWHEVLLLLLRLVVLLQTWLVLVVGGDGGRRASGGTLHAHDKVQGGAVRLWLQGWRHSSWVWLRVVLWGLCRGGLMALLVWPGDGFMCGAP